MIYAFKYFIENDNSYLAIRSFIFNARKEKKDNEIRL